MTYIPKPSIPFKFSRTALSIVIAASLLAALLTTVTFRNIQREQVLMENFLFHEGLALIRSFEAGARTSMRHLRQGTDPLTTLVEEMVKEEAVAYIQVFTENGDVLAEAGEIPPHKLRPPLTILFQDKHPLTTLLADHKVFEVASFFKPISSGNRAMERMMGRWAQGPEQRIKELFNQRGGVIYLGLRTKEFDRARHEDVRNALIFGGILFLAGSAGFYLIFLYQGVRVARSTLADMELYTKNVIESMPAGLITLDVEGRVVSCNKQAENISGISLNRLDGKVLTQELAQFPPFTVETEPLLDEPFTCSREDGTHVPIKVSSSALFSSDGKKTGVVLILRDVGEILEMEQKLERVRRLAALGRMAAGIAHEIRNPLGTLKGFAQYFGKQFKPETTEKEYADLMVDEVDRLNRSISALLQFSKPREPEFKKISINDILTKTGKLLNDDLRGKNINFKLNLPDDEIFIEADSDLLLQVFLNLVQNSLAACETSAEITISAKTKKNSVLLCVQDSGTGMTSDEVSRMFDPFFTTKKSGTGLGLAVVHQIIEQHGGAVAVESEVGKGTKIDFTLPLEHRRSMGEA